MIVPRYFYRNDRSSELLELFLVSAITCLLLVRFFLHLTGYPQISGRDLHVAHMLPGGILMVAALVITMAFLGSRVQRLASIVGGIGFGLFIDEIGKFITHDNNYFFRPTIALIYLIFILLFLAFRTLSNRQRHISKEEHLLNALSLLEEAVINELDPPELKRILAHLQRSDADHPLVKPLHEALKRIDAQTESQPIFLRRWLRWIERRYQKIVSTTWGIRLIDAVFALKAGIFLTDAIVDAFRWYMYVPLPGFALVSVLQFTGSLVSTVFVVAGITIIRRSRLRAYELFTRSLLVDIFVVQFFAFYQKQFDALPGFILSILLYIALRFLVRQERRVQRHS
jgi:hypothetical protein